MCQYQLAQVVSQLRGLTSLLETVDEWQLGDELERTRERGRRLAQVGGWHYGPFLGVILCQPHVEK